MFLNETEVFELTGHKTKKAQKLWLEENNFKFWENAKGKIVVPRGRTEKRTKAVRYTNRSVMNISEAIGAAETFKACEAGVYLLFDGEEVVYVGKTLNVFMRVGQHIADKNFDTFKLIRLAPEELDTWERELIATLRPKYNKLIIDVPQPSRTGA